MGDDLGQAGAGQCALRSVEAPVLVDWSDCMRELSMHILDVMQNSLEADATLIEVTIVEDLAADRLTITVRDNGHGMSAEQVAQIADPFFTTRTTRHVGLGIPLFKAAAERCNGSLTVTSQPAQGTTVEAVFQHSHIDRAPLGNITGTLMAVILTGAADLHYVHRVDDREFEFHTADIRTELGDVSLTHPAVRQWIQEFIAEGEADLNSSG